MAALTRVLPLLLLGAASRAWDLAPLAHSLRHVSLVGPRAFLSVDRPEGGAYTLLVAPWPELPNTLPSYAKPYPSKDEQILGNCTWPQAAVASVWDGLSRLLVLDSGSEASAYVSTSCPAKILAYNVFTNKLMGSTELGGVSGSRLSSLAMEPAGSRVYVVEPAPGHLLVAELASGRWWTLALSPAPAPAAALGHLALLGPRLYLASRTIDTLHSLDTRLSLLRHPPTPTTRSNNVAEEQKRVEVEMEEHGSLLGAPSGLVGHRHWLYYWLARDYALVRWDSRLPLRAEGHDVVMQSADQLPLPPLQLFLDAQRQLWALAAAAEPTNGTYCVRLTRPLL